MSARGRPPHAETLTPRQQEVFALLREGLTNEQIAERLGIGVDGVKYHVAEVLQRLGVANRYDAALVDPAAARRRWARGLFGLLLLPRPRMSALGYAAGAAAVAVVLVALAVLAVGVLRTHPSDRQNLAARLASRELVATKTGSARWHIAVFDGVAMKPVAAFDAGGGGEQPSAAVIAGDRIVVN